MKTVGLLFVIALCCGFSLKNSFISQGDQAYLRSSVNKCGTFSYCMMGVDPRIIIKGPSDNPTKMENKYIRYKSQGECSGAIFDRTIAYYDITSKGDGNYELVNTDVTLFASQGVIDMYGCSLPLETETSFRNFTCQYVPASSAYHDAYMELDSVKTVKLQFSDSLLLMDNVMYPRVSTEGCIFVTETPTSKPSSKPSNNTLLFVLIGVGVVVVIVIIVVVALLMKKKKKTLPKK